MKYRNTIAAFLVLAALLAVAYFSGQSGGGNGAATPTAGPEMLLIDLKAEEITSIQISTPVSRTVMHRDGETWLLDEPTKEEADTERLNETAGTFAKVRVSRTLTDTPSSLEPFGLVTGTLTVTLQLKDNRTELLRFGNPIVGTGAYYAQKPGDARVHLVSPFYYGEAQRLLTLTPRKPTPTPVPPTPVPSEAPQGPAPAPTPTETPRP